MAAFEPYVQGAFDGLCGLYSVVNGIRLAVAFDDNLSKVQCRTVFNRGMEYLEDTDCGDIVRNGLPSKNWHALARHIFHYVDERYGIKFMAKRATLRKLPEDFDEALREIEEAVRSGVPVAVELQRALNHYTVVMAAEAGCWQFFDSSGYKSIKKASLGGHGSGARHVLGPRAIFFARRP